MQYALEREQTALRKSLVQACGKEYLARASYVSPAGPAVVDATAEPFWQTLSDIGVSGLGISDELGGTGGGVIDQMVVAEVFGEFLVVAPFLGTAAAAALVWTVAPGDERLARIAGGEPHAVAFTEPGAITAVGGDDVGWSLTGTAELVIDGSMATAVFVVAVVEGVSALFVVEGDALQAARVVIPCVDHTRLLADLVLDDAAATRIESPQGVSQIDRGIEAALQLAHVLLAAESVGAAARVLAFTAEYARERVQFSHPIGTFQAVKHKLSDMLVRTENARSAVYGAAWALRDDTPDRDIFVAMAKAIATENAVSVAGAAIQLHGGIGMTWDQDVHLYLRRAKCNELLLGPPAAHLERIASVLLDA